MNYRIAELLAEKTFTADATETIDIDLVDPISEIVLFLKTLNNGANTAPTAHFAAGITKIELVDGSDVLYSLDGYEAQAVDYYNRGQLRSPWNAYLDNNRGDTIIGMPFGRKLWDRALAFDPKKFSNPQLKVSLDVGAGGIASDELKLEVQANVFDERVVAPTGFLMSKEIKEYQMGSATHEYTTLPNDYIYRKMFIAARVAGTEPNQVLDTVKLSEETDKKIPFNAIGVDSIERAIAFKYGLIHENIIQWCGTTATYGYCVPTTRVYGTAQLWAAAVAAGAFAFYDGDGGRYKIITETSVKNANVCLSGYVPHAVYEIPFGLDDDIDDWYDVTKIDSLKLDIKSKAAGSGNDAQIVLQQLRNY